MRNRKLMIDILDSLRMNPDGKLTSSEIEKLFGQRAPARYLGHVVHQIELLADMGLVKISSRGDTPDHMVGLPVSIILTQAGYDFDVDGMPPSYPSRTEELMDQIRWSKHGIEQC